MTVNLNDLGTQLLYSTIHIIGTDVNNKPISTGTGFIIDINLLLTFI